MRDISISFRSVSIPPAACDLDVMEDSADAALQEAGELHRRGNLHEAEKLYKVILQQRPTNGVLLHRYGALLAQLYGNDKLESARDFVHRAVQLAPGNASYRNSLGVLSEKMGDLDAAIDAFERAHEKDRANVKVMLNLARVCKAAGRKARAAEVYGEVVRCEPLHATAHYKRAWLLKQLGRRNDAVIAYRQHLELQPSCEQTRFWIAALTGDYQAVACPASMVAGLFDSYAQEFDEHLVNKLGYQTPQLLVAALQHIVGSTKRWRRCFDVGCGTGLMGPLLRPLVDTLEGVDLSAGMVDQARVRQCYDTLEVMELVAFLGRHQQNSGQGACQSQQGADLIVAADVFVYIGDLQPVMAAAAGSSAPAAQFCFSIEQLDDLTSAGCGYQLQQTGRYKHRVCYIRDVAASTGWAVLHSSTSTIRFNLGKPVDGVLFVLQRG